MSEDGEQPRFLVDHMLGSLARWLRMLGYDARYDKKLTDDLIVVEAKAEGRMVLTRDRALSERCGGFLLEITDLDGQLAAVAERFSLRYRPDGIRCSVCNGRLLAVDREKAKGLVPEKSLESSSEFWVCDSCHKAYWIGTHWDGIMERFRKLGLTEEKG